MPRQPSGNGDSPQPPSSAAPFHSRSTTRAAGAGGGDGGNTNTNQPSSNNNSNNSPPQNIKSDATTKIFFQPTVHQFTCRGAFHLQPDATNDTPQDSDKEEEEDEVKNNNTNTTLEKVMKDTFLCHGIQSSLRHVADYPLARSKDDAIHWFEGSSSNINTMGGSSSSGGGIGSSTGGSNNHSSTMKNNNNEQRSNEDDKDEDEGMMIAKEVEPESTFSSYGTTQVNILTVQEVPVKIANQQQQEASEDENRTLPFSNNNDPFSGFGALGGTPGGMLNPFGSLFGGFFGGGGGGGSMMGDHDPWSNPGGMGGVEDDDDKSSSDVNKNKNNRRKSGWMKGASRSVSSSTRMERDAANGKRVVTTVTQTTIVDNEGKERTEVVTTKRHVDDGGRVETNKVVKTNYDGGGVGDDNHNQKKVKANGAAAVAVAAAVDKDKENNNLDQMGGSSPFPATMAAMDAMRRGDNSRATMNALNRGLNGGAAAMVASEPTKPAEVAVIATDCLLGVSISDSVSTDPDSAFPPSSSSAASSKKKTTSDSNSKSGWRKTEYLFKLGRFVPPFMLVAKYYKDEEEEERRRNETTREYNELRDRHKKSRWDKASARDEDEKVSLTTNADNTSSSSSKERLSEVSTRTEYYLQRIYVQMIKNMNMMSYLSTEVICKPDFPKKVQLQGQKIYDNIGPTAERTGKLMGDVWDMWMVSFLGRSKSPGDDDNNGGSKRGW